MGDLDLPRVNAAATARLDGAGDVRVVGRLDDERRGHFVLLLLFALLLGVGKVGRPQNKGEDSQQYKDFVNPHVRHATPPLPGRQSSSQSAKA
jgi:hypothetical protein